VGKIYYFKELEEYFGTDDWRLQIDVSDIWYQYQSSGITLNVFNDKYYNRLLKYQKNIGDLGNDVWEDIKNIMVKMKENNNTDDLMSIYDKIYDWADGNDILIKCK
jgi:hypothetical protein